MNVVVLDGFSVSSRGKGVSRALVNIITHLVTMDGDVHYVVLTRTEGRSLLGHIPSGAVRVVPDMIGSVWEQVGLPIFARRFGASLVYTQRECVPFSGPPVVAHIHENPEPRWSRCRTARFRERARIRYDRMVMFRSIRRAIAVVASSHAVAQWLSTSVAPRSVRVVHLGVEEAFFRTEPALEKRDYIFHLGSTDPRDNTELVIRAYQRLRNRRGTVPSLIIAGALEGIERRLGLQAGDRSIRVVGWVPDRELARLYAGALVCVQPSTDEGFGLQPLEAMAAGAPLVVFDNPAVREVVGQAAVYISTVEEDVLVVAIEQLLDDPRHRNELRLEGRVRAGSFTWAATAKALQDLFIDVLQGAKPHVARQ